MKEQLKSVILPPLPIVGILKLTTRDHKSLYSVEVIDAKNKADRKFDPFFEDCFQKISNYLTQGSKEINIKADLRELTSFQKSVLKTMKSVPYGEVSSYKNIGKKMNSHAYQAIGSACGKNPLLLIYPCHRIVGTNNLGGFAHGIDMKKALLELEKHFN